MSTDTANSREIVSEGLTLGPSREELFDATKYGPISSIHPAIGASKQKGVSLSDVFCFD